ncbi:hypothetical protein FGG08_007450, partial [Glutinoglossum americanum]
MFSLTKDLISDDIPQYAIFSHTWGADVEEVTFEDLVKGSGKSKTGYQKIHFCGEQPLAMAYNISGAELQEAINSMFRWYRNAAKCYVYLSDVSRPAFDSNDKFNQLPWESTFRKSRWFTRGWTLQELIAPASVEFFSKDWERLGNKKSLERHIHEITGIPVKALQGSPLSDFSVTERMLWADKRETTRKEDKAYSLLGIFDIHMSLIYGEGRDNALTRLREEIGKALKGRIFSQAELCQFSRQILREHPSASQLSSADIKRNFDEVMDAVKAWLSLPNNMRWLMIYDNYDNPKLPGNMDPAALDIRKFLPESYQGSIIITTRSSRVKIGHTIQIRKLEDVHDSLEILSNTSRREGLINDPDATRLVKVLDGLPLALATAGAYLDQVSVSLSDYLRLYKASWAKLQKTSPELSSYEDRTLYSTWQLSFDRVKQQNELSAKLLRLWAYFDNQDIWYELLRHGDSEDPEWICELTEDELSFNGAVRVLSDHGLLEVDTSSQERVEARGYSIHGCVHSWTIHVLNQEWDYGLARLALKFVGSHVAEDEAVKWWLTRRRLLQHATRCSYNLLNGLVSDDGMAWACHNLGLLYVDQGKLDEAEKMYQRALQGYEKAWGPDHTSTLNTVNNLGNLYAGQGKLGEAEKMYQRALQGKEKAWGPDHTSTLNTVNNLGNLYADQGKLGEAEKMYQRALQGYEKAWGPDHTSTLDTVNNLGSLYKSRSKLDEAERMYQRALQGYEKAWGPDHTSTLDTVNNLGNLYADQGKLDEAEEMYQRALQGKEKAW